MILWKGFFGNSIILWPSAQGFKPQFMMGEGMILAQCAEIVDTAITVDGAHALTHQLLLRVGGAEVVKLLAPQIDLITEIHLDRAHSLTTQTECAGTYVARVLLGVAKHTEVYADGAWDKVAVGIAA
jgi:hypothetical protein